MHTSNQSVHGEWSHAPRFVKQIVNLGDSVSLYWKKEILDPSWLDVNNRRNFSFFGAADVITAEFFLVLWPFVTDTWEPDEVVVLISALLPECAIKGLWLVQLTLYISFVTTLIVSFVFLLTLLTLIPLNNTHEGRCSDQIISKRSGLLWQEVKWSP